jgi:hypothetical protein
MGRDVYRTGIVEGFFPDNPPKREDFFKWFKSIKKYIKDNDLDVQMHICGNFLVNPNKTLDVDIILYHPDVKDFKHEQLLKMRDLMIHSVKIGYENELMIDIQMYLPYDNDGNFWVKPIDYLKYGKITTKSLSYFDKVYINDIMVQDLKECFVDVKMIDENLYMNTCLSPDDKWVERVKRGVFYKDPIRLI